MAKKRKIIEAGITSKLLELVRPVIWTYTNGQNRCNGCGNWEFEGKHKPDCIYGELIRRIKENVK